ncbi:MAG: sulfotransferase [Gomphosphaeria aponina SAG 52.96 = DSM 107014]|uniref:Sulfotransferase n=1 Tax=Gomphosphaeria aponina SAG 52.96 = DSM 107014 TaxID=1521640 RepID=A0A941JSL3_9CHRO|nr:sulfotransferase [Gomphosphaeria aponina SAG 52.96 = DSM 107014]
MYFSKQTLLKILKATYISQEYNLLHAAYTSLLITLFFGVRTLIKVSQTADKILFSQYQNQKITAPLFITGNPRSGTTFLHHLLANDPQLTTTKLYQTIFPSISFYRLFQSTERLKPLFADIDNKIFKGWQGIHKTQLDEVEEDETIFVWAMLTPVIFLMFPFAQLFQENELTWVDNLGEETRQQLMTYYQDFLKRHLYATGSDKTLLIKNTTSTGRLRSMIQTLPDMRIIHLIRHPYQAIPSLLSMYAAPWQTLVPQTKNNNQAYYNLAQLYANYYRSRMEIFNEFNKDLLIEIAYEDFRREPLMTIKQIYDKFDLTMEQTFQDKLEEKLKQNAGYQSYHRYSLDKFGLNEKMIYEMMEDVFEFYGFQS